MAASMHEGLKDRDLSSHGGLASTEAKTTMGHDPIKRGKCADMYGDVETGDPEHHPPGQQRSNAPELNLLRKSSNHKPAHGWTPDRGPGPHHPPPPPPQPSRPSPPPTPPNHTHIRLIIVIPLIPYPLRIIRERASDDRTPPNRGPEVPKPGCRNRHAQVRLWLTHDGRRKL
jgi:hypothetical protein